MRSKSIGCLRHLYWMRGNRKNISRYLSVNFSSFYLNVSLLSWSADFLFSVLGYVVVSLSDHLLELSLNTKKHFIKNKRYSDSVGKSTVEFNLTLLYFTESSIFDEILHLFYNLFSKNKIILFVYTLHLVTYMNHSEILVMTDNIVWIQICQILIWWHRWNSWNLKIMSMNSSHVEKYIKYLIRLLEWFITVIQRSESYLSC